jgi:ATP-dependent protease ClpP protease subunit
MFKAIIMGVCLALAVGGCTINNGVQREQNVDSDFETLPNGELILSGNVDGDTYKEFLRATSTGKKHYTLKIMTNGGCAYNTVAVMNRIELLQSQGVKFTMIVPGKGFSAGSYIFMMGDERIMYRGSFLMWHTITGQAKFNEKTIAETHESLIRGLDEYVVGKFVELFPHITKEWVDSTFWNSGMTWQTAEQALLMGIATKIVN